MRKFTIAAGAAIIASLIAVPIASAFQAPEPELTMSVTPTKAGKKSKPKSSKLKLKIVNPDPSLTASRLVITMPSTVKLNTRGFAECDADELEAEGTSACPSASKIGSGVAHARSGVNTATPTPLTFDLTAFIIGNKKLGFFIEQQGGAIRTLAEATIKSRKLDISIPQLAQEFPTGTFNGLVDIQTSITKKRGRNALVTTTGCKQRKHTFGLEITYIANPLPENAGTAETTDDARCSA